MIYDTLAAIDRYRGLSQRFDAAFRYLTQVGRGEFTLGRTEIIPGEVWASTVRKPARAIADATFEYHERFADIHFCISGCDEFGWAPTMDGVKPVTEFDLPTDNGGLFGPPLHFLPLSGSQFAVVFPREPHAPHVGAGEITRACIKVLVHD